MLRLAFDFIITWRETRTRPNAYVLGTHMVDSCCVVYDFKNKQIVLFYQSHEDLNLGEFRKSILKFIPRYMMPTVNNRVESMEINANGKIDRKYYTALLNG